MKMSYGRDNGPFSGRLIVCEQDGRQSVVIAGLSVRLDNKAETGEWLKTRMVYKDSVVQDLVKCGRMQLMGMQIGLSRAIRPREANHTARPDTPQEAPTWAALGMLGDWELYLVNIRCGGEVWFNFVNVKEGLYEMWQAVDAETGGPICQMRICLSDSHYYDYQYCPENGETTLAERWGTAAENEGLACVITITKEGEITTAEEH